jgi:2-polyprenyl-3-methyl-5-hydroxy-6-metoxy-1,4-benzoquinol methylase
MRCFKNPESNRSVRKSKDELHDYWRSPDEMNNPSSYLQASKRIEYLVSLVKQYVKPNASILELGCNVGRNLYQLWKAGYHSLSGVEINPEALKLMKQNFPDMQVITYEGTIEDRIKELGKYDLVFTMAVLEHIHSDSEWVFPEIAKRARMLITIEGEKKNVSELHFPRNYKNIFEALGLHQIYEKHLSQKEGLNTKFYTRVFTKTVES